MSDKQEAFVKAIAAEFPEVPHRYCDNHFLRDLAKPVLEADSHAKVAMRKKVRGLRVIEQAVLARQKAKRRITSRPRLQKPPAPRPWRERTGLRPWLSRRALWCSSICAAVRASSMTIRRAAAPSGLRMAEALGEVSRVDPTELGREKRGSPRSNLAGSRDASRRVSTKSKRSKR